MLLYFELPWNHQDIDDFIFGNEESIISQK